MWATSSEKKVHHTSSPITRSCSGLLILMFVYQTANSVTQHLMSNARQNCSLCKAVTFKDHCCLWPWRLDIFGKRVRVLIYLILLEWCMNSRPAGNGRVTMARIAWRLLLSVAGLLMSSIGCPGLQCLHLLTPGSCFFLFQIPGSVSCHSNMRFHVPVWFSLWGAT